MVPGMSEDLVVWNTVTPHDTQDVLQAAHVECVGPFFFFPCLEGPRLIATQEGGENTGTVYCHVGVGVEFSQLCNKHT